MPTPPPAGPGAVRCQHLQMIFTNDGRFGPYFGSTVDVPRRDLTLTKTPQLCFDIATALQGEGREVLQIKKETLIQYATDFVRKTHPEAVFEDPKKTTSKKSSAAPPATEAPAVAAPTPPAEIPIASAPESTAPVAEAVAPVAVIKPKRNLKPLPVQPQVAAEVPVAPIAGVTTPTAPATTPPTITPPVQPQASAPVTAPASAPEPRKLVDKIDVNLAIFSLIGSAFVLTERDTTPGANERRVKLAAVRDEYLKIVTG